MRKSLWTKIGKLTVAAAVLAGCFTLIPPTAQADTLAFSLNIPAYDIFTYAVSASGTLTLGPFDSVNNDWTIIGITGNVTYNGVAGTITGLVGPGGLGGNDNLLYASSPYLDGNGVTFTCVSCAGGDDGAGNINLFYSTDPDPRFNGHTTDNENVGFAPNGFSVPEPGSVALMLIGVGSGWVMRKRKALGI
jgi:hypothetical protein